MDYIRIDKTSKEPLYMQIKHAIKVAILNGTLRHMDHLPTEKEFCEIYGTSVIVIKNAYDELVKEGLVLRIKGKGTFVSTRKTYTVPLKNFYNLEFFSEHALFEIRKKVLLFEVMKSPSLMHQHLNLSSDDYCYHVKLIVYLKRDPVMYQTLYLPKSYFPNIDIETIESSTILDLFQNESRVAPKHLQNLFKPHNLTSSEAQLLDSKKMSAAHFVRTLVSSKDNVVFAEIINIYPGETTRFEAFIK